jgi:hypothetical protein
MTAGRDLHPAPKITKPQCSTKKKKIQFDDYFSVTIRNKNHIPSIHEFRFVL